MCAKFILLLNGWADHFWQLWKGNFDNKVSGKHSSKFKFSTPRDFCNLEELEKKCVDLFWKCGPFFLPSKKSHRWTSFQKEMKKQKFRPSTSFHPLFTHTNNNLLLWVQQTFVVWLSLVETLLLLVNFFLFILGKGCECFTFLGHGWLFVSWHFFFFFFLGLFCNVVVKVQK